MTNTYATKYAETHQVVRGLDQAVLDAKGPAYATGWLIGELISLINDLPTKERAKALASIKATTIQFQAQERLAA